MGFHLDQLAQEWRGGMGRAPIESEFDRVTIQGTRSSS